MKYSIVGPGNIGEECGGTRHNIGFAVLDKMSKASIFLSATIVMR